MQQHSRDSSWASYMTAEDTYHNQNGSVCLKRSLSVPGALRDVSVEGYDSRSIEVGPGSTSTSYGPSPADTTSTFLDSKSHPEDTPTRKRTFSRKLGFFGFLQKISEASGSRSTSSSTISSTASSETVPRSSTGLISPPASPTQDQGGFIEYIVAEKSSAVLTSLRLRQSTSLQTVLPRLDYKQKQKQTQTQKEVGLDVLDLVIPQSASRSSSKDSTLADSAADELSELRLVRQDACSRALRIPEILSRVLYYVDEENLVPRELAQRRRKPMSLRHAMLIYGDSTTAREAWAKAQSDEKKWSHEIEKDMPGGLYSCLFVNSFWHSITIEVLYKKLHFRDAEKWALFAQQSLAAQADAKEKENSQVKLRSTCFVVHKINTASQEDIERIGGAIGGNLQWLEFYTCPFIVPTKELLISRQLKKLVLPGCSKVSNRTVALIAQHCPQLEHLDLRACEQVSDWGLKQLGKNCRKLKLLNVGRTNHGELITYRGIKYIARLTNVDTLGLAGCHIDDRAVWEIAVHRGSKIERLSLNNCINLTNESIPRVLPYAYNLSVLELRGCVQITNMKPIILFKRYRERLGHPPLIEGCEVFEMRMKEAEWMMEMEASRTIIADCLEWIYAEDSDIPHTTFLATVNRIGSTDTTVSTVTNIHTT